jgi:hypothetical protein
MCENQTQASIQADPAPLRRVSNDQTSSLTGTALDLSCDPA